MKIIIFDIDSTIADNSHRQVHLMKEPKDWASYNQNHIEDGLHEDIAFLMNTLRLFGCTIILATGREECYREVTERWLKKMGLDYYRQMYMREDKDYRNDAIIKQEMLTKIRYEWGEDPYMVFDDRNRVVDMWRSNGIRCLQVQSGNY